MGGVISHQNPPRDGEGDRAAKRRGGGGSSRSLRRPEVYEARRARQEMSLPEVLLWQRLKGGVLGVSFRKQHPIGAYRADFYCASARLVVEIDGIAHDMGDRPARDERREQMLMGKGYHLVRIPAADVLRDPNGIAASVAALASSPPPPLAGGERSPSPCRGGSVDG